MKKKLIMMLVFMLAIFVATTAGVLAASQINLVVNGKAITDVEAKLIDGSTYVPLRAVSQMLGATVDWNGETRTVSISDNGTPTPKPSDLSSTIKDVTIQVNKVEQDSDSLRLYVTYINNSNKEAMTGDSLAKIIYAGKQYEYDSDFNFSRYYETGVDKAQDFIEPGVTEKSVIFFKPIPDVGAINIVLNANFEDYRYNNVKVSK